MKHVQPFSRSSCPGLSRSAIVSLILLMLAPAHVRAGDIMDGAKRATEATHLVAMDFGQSLVRADFQLTLNALIQELARSEETYAQVGQLVAEIDALEDDFQSIADMDTADLARTREQLEKMRDSYRELVHRRFDASWIQLDLATKHRLMAPKMKAIVDDLSARCELGHSFEGVDFTTPGLPPLPKFFFEYNVSFGSGGGSVEGNTHSGVREKPNDWTQAGHYAGGAGMVLTSIAITNSTGIWAFAASAGPACLAVAAVCYAVGHFVALAERNRAQAEMARADEHRFRHTAGDADVRKHYSDYCHSLTERLDEVRETLEVIEAGGDAASQLLTDARERIPEIEAFENGLAEIYASQCRDRLFKQVADCEPTSAESATGGGDSGPCRIEGDEWVAENGLCRLPTDPEAMKAQIEKDQEAIKAFGQEYQDDGEARLWSLVRDKLVLVLSQNRDQLVRQLGQVRWDAVDQLQERAFLRLMSFHRLVRANMARGVGELAIEKELAIAGRFEEFRRRYYALVTETIRAIFDPSLEPTVTRLESEFETEWRVFFRKYLHHPEVRTLEAAYADLRELIPRSFG